MRILVVSDTHGDRAAMDRLLDKEHDFDRIFHLGDNYRDAGYLAGSTAKPVECVPGNCDFERAAGTILVTVGGKRFFLTHGHNYGVGYSLTRLCLAAQEKEADAVLFGHTHRPVLDWYGAMTVLNPGSLSRPRASHAGYAVIEITEEGILKANLMEI